MGNTSILIIYTGGTIGMIADAQTGALSPFSLEKILEHVPSIKDFPCDIKSYVFEHIIDSSNMHPKFWVKLADVIAENYNEYDGFVVLHGTDTMSYTASALSFMLENLNKPVVLTGSQLPIGTIRTDGRENIINAIEIAIAKSGGQAVVPEVTICFENKLYRGNRTTKFNAENFDAFLSGNYPLLAETGVHIKYMKNLILHPSELPLKVYTHLDNRISILKLYPGISPEVVHAVLHTEDLKAVILETYGSGNGPTEKWFLDAISDAVERGIIIYNVTQCKAGSVDQGKYATSFDLERIGVISGYDITTESAVTKLMFLLGNYTDKEEIKRLLQISLRGEITIENE